MGGGRRWGAIRGNSRLIVLSSLTLFSRSEYVTTLRLQDDDSFFGVDQKTSTRFDRNFSITDFLKINLGTEVALPLVSRQFIVRVVEGNSLTAENQILLRTGSLVALRSRNANAPATADVETARYQHKYIEWEGR